MKLYYSRKDYGHNEGLSCTFRQWRASSHCNEPHGYSMGFGLQFAAWELDYRNWVQDFGGLKEVKEFLKHWFDHTTLIAQDDPDLDYFQEGERRGVYKNLRILPAVGCEAFADFVFDWMKGVWLPKHHTEGRVWIDYVEAREHSSNSAGVREVMQSVRQEPMPPSPLNQFRSAT